MARSPSTFSEASTTMEFLIQLLLAVGGGVFLAIAISAWFADRQIVAVWLGYAGVVIMLGAVALFTHLYVVTSVVQPKIELEPPPAPSHFRWENEQTGTVIKGPADQLLPGGSQAPSFTISNASKVLAADLSIEWIAPPIDQVQLAGISAQFGAYVHDLHPGHLRIGAQFYQAVDKVRTSIPFLNRPSELGMPINIWWRAMPILVTRLPNFAGPQEFEMPFQVIVSWNIPDRGKPQKFLVLAKVRNTKTPTDTALMDADVTFSVKSIE